MKLLPDEKKSQGPGATTRAMPKKKMAFFSDDFVLRSPIIQKPFQTKSATSMSLHGSSGHLEGLLSGAWVILIRTSITR